MSRDHAILGVFKDISDARESLHGNYSGQYVAREDGIVVAYMSREGQTWKPMNRVTPDIRAKFSDAKAATASDL